MRPSKKKGTNFSIQDLDLWMCSIKDVLQDMGVYFHNGN